jgi:hypothetical protein
MWKITLLPKEKRPGLRPINISGWNKIPYHKVGQVGIEASIAFVTIIIFLWGVTQLFLELNRSIVNRQRHYQTSRTQLGSESAIDFYDGRITIFPEER